MNSRQPGLFVNPVGVAHSCQGGNKTQSLRRGRLPPIAPKVRRDVRLLVLVSLTSCHTAMTAVKWTASPGSLSSLCVLARTKASNFGARRWHHCRFVPWVGVLFLLTFVFRCSLSFQRMVGVRRGNVLVIGRPVSPWGLLLPSSMQRIMSHWGAERVQTASQWDVERVSLRLWWSPFLGGLPWRVQPET